MKREILCVNCFNELDYARMKYPGEHVKTVIGNLRQVCVCDGCGCDLNSCSAVACLSIWTDELESRGRGYCAWEYDYIIPVDVLTMKIFQHLKAIGKEAYANH